MHRMVSLLFHDVFVRTPAESGFEAPSRTATSSLSPRPRARSRPLASCVTTRPRWRQASPHMTTKRSSHVRRWGSVVLYRVRGSVGGSRLAWALLPFRRA